MSDKDKNNNFQWPAYSANSSPKKNKPAFSEFIPFLKSFSKGREPATRSFRYLARLIEADFQHKENGTSIVLTSPEQLQFTTDALLMLGFSLQKELDGKVLIIDSTLRDDGISTRLGNKNHPGFIELLENNPSQLDRYTVETALSNIKLLPSGKLSDNPTFNVNRGKLKQLLEVSIEKYDYVLMEQGSILKDTRYLMANEFVDVSFILVRENSTLLSSHDDFKKLFNNYQISNFRVILIALK